MPSAAMARDRKGAQLNLEVEPQLLERLRARAAADGRPLAALVRRWLEAGLSGALEQQATAAAPAAGAELLARVEALEAAVADLQRPASPERVSAAPRVAQPVTPKRVPLGPGQLEIIGAAHLQAGPSSPDPPPGPITTGELAGRTGSNRGAWNNWASKATPGDVRHHPQAGSWRLIGKAALDAGGPARWLWEPA
jgi:plasmid stability protein